MKTIKRIIFFISLFLLYFIFKEFIELYNYTSSIHPYFGYVTVVILFLFTIYFAVVPLFKILKIPKRYSPAKDEKEVDDLLKFRLDNFKKNKFLKEQNFDFTDLDYTRENYDSIISVLEKKSKKIRKKYVSRLFYSTSIAQNGFLDAIFILSASVNMMKETFILFQGRVSNRDLLIIGKKVYYSMAIGGSEGIEYATGEIFSKLSTDAMKSIPFASKILGSLADGFVNAALLTRISLITENYCKMLYIKTDKDLYPAPTFVVNTTSYLISDVLNSINKKLITTPKDKFVEAIKNMRNPLAFLFKKNDLEEFEIESSKNV